MKEKDDEDKSPNQNNNTNSGSKSENVAKGGGPVTITITEGQTQLIINDPNGSISTFTSSTFTSKALDFSHPDYSGQGVEVYITTRDSNAPISFTNYMFSKAPDLSHVDFSYPDFTCTGENKDPADQDEGC